MSREIVEAVQNLEREKGISSEKLMLALEDALLSAYKKTPGAARYARVDMDRDTADFRVFELILPPELEEKLVNEAIEEERTIDPETGELREPEEPEIDLEKLAEYQDQIDTRDVTPTDFGRIAAQTAKQVILQRIREAERDMMFEEYQDRVGEMITGIIQQSDSRYTLVQLRERVEALLPKSEQVDGERYDHGMRVKAVITEVSASGKGPSIIVSRRSPELIKKLFELEVPEVADSLVEIVNVAREPGLPVEDRRGVARRRRGPGRRLRRPPRLARAHGRVRAARREDRHHPLQRGARAVRREGAVARARARGAGRRREQAGDGRRAGRPALAGDRQGGPERPPRRAADGLARGHQVRDRVRRGGGRARARSRRRRSPAAATRAVSTGKRCPNAALPGSRYCGLPAHQALAEQERAAADEPAPDEPPPRSLRAEEAAAEEPAAEEPSAEEPSPRSPPPRSRSPSSRRTEPTRTASPSEPPTGRGRRGTGRRGRGADRLGGPVSPVAKKRVYEIAKEKGVSSKDLVSTLQAAGLDVKAAASTRRGGRGAEGAVGRRTPDGHASAPAGNGPGPAAAKSPPSPRPRQAGEQGNAPRRRPRPPPSRPPRAPRRRPRGRPPPSPSWLWPRPAGPPAPRRRAGGGPSRKPRRYRWAPPAGRDRLPGFAPPGAAADAAAAPAPQPRPRRAAARAGRGRHDRGRRAPRRSRSRRARRCATSPSTSACRSRTSSRS